MIQTVYNLLSRRGAPAVILICCITTSVGCAAKKVVSITDPSYSIDQDEKALIDEADRFSETLQRSQFVLHKPEWATPLNKMVSCLAPQSWPHGRVQPKVFIVDDPILNAFALPNGHIFINIGVLALASSEDQIAVILAHELTHVIERHALLTKRTATRSGAVYGVLALPAAAFGGIAGSLGLDLAVVSSMLGYSRQMEREADQWSAQTVALKGYDSSQGIQLFENMKRALEKEDIKEPFFFSTHPALVERIEMFQTLTEENKSSLSHADSDSCRVWTEDAFARVHNEWVLHAADRALDKGWYRLAEYILETSWLSSPPDKTLKARRLFMQGLLWQERQDGPKKNKPRSKDKDWEKAATYFKMAYDTDPHLVESLKRLAIMQYKKGDVQAARQTMGRYFALVPDDSQRDYWEELLSSAKAANTDLSDPK